MITGILYRFVNKRICIGKVKNENLRIVFEVLELKKFRNVFMLAIGGRINVLRRMFTAARFGVTLRSNSIEVVSRLLLNSRGFLLGQMNIAPVWPPATLHFCLSFSRETLYKVWERLEDIFPSSAFGSFISMHCTETWRENIKDNVNDFFLKNIWGALSLWCGWWATWSSFWFVNSRENFAFLPSGKKTAM